MKRNIRVTMMSVNLFFNSDSAKENITKNKKKQKK